jgi:hypothetical protein
MDQKRFHSIANGRALALCIYRNALSHVEVGVIIHVDMAYAVVMFDDRHAGMFDDGFDKRRPAARDDEVDILTHRGHESHRIAVLCRDELNRVGRQTFSRSSGLERLGDCQV